MKDINKFIDHTMLKSDATENEIRNLCEEAIKYDFASVCVNPCHVKLSKSLLKGTDVKVCTVIGFPLGANTSECKVFETENAFLNGCDEFDMVINVGALKDGNYSLIKDEITAVIAAAKGKCVKVIVESALLEENELAKITRTVCECKADYIKTCTGFTGGVATKEAVKIMKENLSGKTKIKASAGIRDYKKAKELIDSGADRIGTSSGCKIMEEF